MQRGDDEALPSAPIRCRTCGAALEGVRLHGTRPRGSCVRCGSVTALACLVCDQDLRVTRELPLDAVCVSCLSPHTLRGDRLACTERVAFDRTTPDVEPAPARALPPTTRTDLSPGLAVLRPTPSGAFREAADGTRWIERAATPASTLATDRLRVAGAAAGIAIFLGAAVVGSDGAPMVFLVPAVVLTVVAAALGFEAMKNPARPARGADRLRVDVNDLQREGEPAIDAARVRRVRVEADRLVADLEGDEVHTLLDGLDEADAERAAEEVRSVLRVPEGER